jgi:carbon monoxide dehydrogenase subunit G
MRHVVFVPVTSRSLRAALADPGQVARAIPGLQQDAGTGPVAGRLKLRIGSHSITYRGTLRVLAREDGAYVIEGDAAEARGTGSVKFALTLGLAQSDDGSTLTYGGTASASGRVTELPPDAVRAAVTRLLDRFAGSLAAGTAEPLSTGDAKTTPDPDTAPAPDDAPDPPPGEAVTGPREHQSVFDVEVPPSSLDPLADEEIDIAEDEAGADEIDDAEDMDDADDADDVVGDVGGMEPGAVGRPAEDHAEAGEAPAEAAHARRTMIGRSAEEVDHAPPRGRYAPVPAPLTVAAGPTLRWAAPTAALVVAGAIVVSRVLRRRR